MTRLFLYCLLATFCFSVAGLAQTKQDAMDFSEKLFDNLCHHHYAITIKPGDSIAEQRSKALQYIRSQALLTSPRFQDIQIASEHLFLEGSANGEIKFFDLNGKFLLKQFLSCRLEDHVSYETSPVSSVGYYDIFESKDLAECHEETGHWNLRKKNGVCVNACPSGAIPRSGILLNSGLYSTDGMAADSASASALKDYSFCVPCGEKSFGGDPGYTVTKNLENSYCFDFDGCIEGFEKLDLRVTPEVSAKIDDLRAYQDGGMSYPMIIEPTSQAVPGSRFGTITKSVCIEKCDSDATRTLPSGDCMPDPQKICRRIKNRIRNLEAIDFSYILKINNYMYCSPEEIYPQFVRAKNGLLRTLQAELKNCNNPNNNERAIRAEQYIFNLWPLAHANSGPPCGMPLETQKNLPIPATSFEDGWAVEQPIDIDRP